MESGKSLEKEVKRQGLRGQGIVALLIGLLLGTILIVAVLVPVTVNVVNNTAANFTPTTRTIADQLQLLEVVAALVLIAGAMAAFAGGRR